MRKLRRVSGPIKTMARMALVLPLLFLLVTALALTLWSAREVAREVTCNSNIKQVQISVMQYTEDWDETLPVNARWAELSENAVKGGMSAKVWHCPGAGSSYSYAFNRALGGLQLSDVEMREATISLFECDAADKNATGGLQDRTHQERHRYGLMYAFLDGHVQFMSRNHAEQSRWLPKIFKQRKK